MSPARKRLRTIEMPPMTAISPPGCCLSSRTKAWTSPGMTVEFCQLSGPLSVLVATNFGTALMNGPKNSSSPSPKSLAQAS